VARIRTIKPDFWTDEKLTECSLSARLFFIGTWNFADDNGNLQRSAKKLKMQIFPADAMDCEPLVQELIAQGVLIEYAVNGEKYLHIKGFTRHQVINRPSKSGLPMPSGNEHSDTTHGALIDGREGKGKEGNNLTNTDVLVVASQADDHQPKRARPEKPVCPHQEILALYHELLPTSPVIRDWTPARAEHLRVRWNEDAKRQNLDWWKRFFDYIGSSPFLTGKVSGANKKPFTPGLDWICKAENFAKIREGRFHDQEAA
jgi:hypothetical protein